MGSSIKIKTEAVRSLAFGSIGAAYAAVGTATGYASRITLVQNLTDEALMFSFDGTTDHFPLPSNGFLLLDLTSNKTVETGLFLREGTVLYVKEIGNPTTGSVYFTAFYA